MYDPLIDQNPGAGLPHVDSYWADTAGSAPEDDGALTGGHDVEVAIIGGGYTGLSCALHLATESGVKPVILEANRTAWGCSGRNGSFARIAGGRASLELLVEHYGERLAQSYFTEMKEGLSTVRSIIRNGRIDCDVQPDGTVKVAHRASRLGALEKEAALLRRVFGYDAEVVGANALADQYHAGAEAYGGLRMTDGFAMHPLKLAWGIHRMARDAGARIHSGSPVTGWNTERGGHRLQTPQGIVRAKHVVVATNGYSNIRLIPAYNERYLPVYSQIIVTKPLSPDQLKNSLPGADCFMDTRNLLHYYRRLPDNRILFGGRSAIEGKDAENPKHSMVLLNSLRAKFPALSEVDIDYSWGGWVSVTRDYLPHVFQFPNVENAYGAMGYCGSGVSFSILSGRRLAELILGKGGSALPFIRMPPPRFPFARFMRLGQRLAYHRYRWLDQRG